MLYYAVKILLSATILVAISEIAKRNSALAALLASLPLTSVLAFVWLHVEGSSLAMIADLSVQIFWLVLPSLVLFLVLAWLLRQGWGFWPALGAATLVMLLCYFTAVWLLRRLGVSI